MSKNCSCPHVHNERETQILQWGKSKPSQELELYKNFITLIGMCFNCTKWNGIGWIKNISLLADMTIKSNSKKGISKISSFLAFKMLQGQDELLWSRHSWVSSDGRYIPPVFWISLFLIFVFVSFVCFEEIRRVAESERDTYCTALKCSKLHHCTQV